MALTEGGRAISAANGGVKPPEHPSFLGGAVVAIGGRRLTAMPCLDDLSGIAEIPLT